MVDVLKGVWALVDMLSIFAENGYMSYLNRKTEQIIIEALRSNKSVLLLGPRQTGKTTLAKRLQIDLEITFLKASERQRFERDPDLLIKEIEALPTTSSLPTVMVDEIQKVPAIMDTVQLLIDERKAKFLLTGSSARKLRRNTKANLLPGRILSLRLDPLTLDEFMPPNIESALYYGSLPEVALMRDSQQRELLLRSYVETYLEEEVRTEALVRDMAVFGRFLELAGIESGNIANFRSIGEDLDIHHATVRSYFEILVDCLVAERIDPITRSSTRKKLTQSSRYLLFDSGVRRVCAGEGTRLIPERLGHILEQYVGLQLLYLSRYRTQRAKIRFWRDPDGPEVDWVIETDGQYIPIEVKWHTSPAKRAARHIQVFQKEYKNVGHGFLVCRTPRPFQIEDRITAIPWQDLPTVFG